MKKQINENLEEIREWIYCIEVPNWCVIFGMIICGLFGFLIGSII